jgi:putative transposase
MAISNRGRTSHSTYFVTSSTFDKRQLLQNPSYAALLLDVIQSHRSHERFDLHAYVIMPDHFHLLLTPSRQLTLERVIQFIKGGFSFRIRKEFGFAAEVWQTSFYDHRVRDWEEFDRLRTYIHMNPVRRRLATMPSEYQFSSAAMPHMDAVPQRLKPAI